MEAGTGSGHCRPVDVMLKDLAGLRKLWAKNKVITKWLYTSCLKNAAVSSCQQRQFQYLYDSGRFENAAGGVGHIERCVANDREGGGGGGGVGLG